MLQVIPFASSTAWYASLAYVAALIGVMEQTGVGAPPLQRHLERVDRDVPVVDSTHGPADDFAQVRHGQSGSGTPRDRAQARDSQMYTGLRVR
jgi:hypothetical protein